MYFVYLLLCKDGTIYTGITTDVERRLAEHKEGKGGRYTRARKVRRLLYFEKQLDKSSALKREVEIKRWTRQKKMDLIRSNRSVYPHTLCGMPCACAQGSGLPCRRV